MLKKKTTALVVCIRRGEQCMGTVQV